MTTTSWRSTSPTSNARTASAARYRLLCQRPAPGADRAQNPADLNADVWKDYCQIQTYKSQSTPNLNRLASPKCATLDVTLRNVKSAGRVGLIQITGFMSAHT